MRLSKTLVETIAKIPHCKEPGGRDGADVGSKVCGGDQGGVSGHEPD